MFSYFRKTNFVFFGSPDFAAIVLEKLVGAGFVPAAVVCNPDKPVGRKKVITAPPAKQRIMNYELRIKEQIKVLQPEKLDNNVRGQLSDVNCQIAIVAAYAKIIPKDIIDLFPRGVIGVHPSLLPKYRGATPIQSAILAGEEETGVTLFMIDEKVDHGKMVSSVKCQVSSEDTYATLLKKLAELSGDLLIETLPRFLAGEIKPEPQNESLATYTKKFTTEDAFIPPETLEAALAGDRRLAEEADRKIRALNPEPGAWTTQNGKRMKILDASAESNGLVLKKIQYEGKKPVTPPSF